MLKITYCPVLGAIYQFTPIHLLDAHIYKNRSERKRIKKNKAKKDAVPLYHR